MPKTNSLALSCDQLWRHSRMIGIGLGTTLAKRQPLFSLGKYDEWPVDTRLGLAAPTT